jgi:N-acetylglucosamine kinase-like BadF-type ATPase
MSSADLQDGACVLGIDGGGTKTAVAALVNGMDSAVRRGIGGPSNIAAVSVAEALASVAAAAQDTGVAFDSIVSVCAGIAGASFIDRRILFQDGLARLFPNARVEVLPDYAIALEAGTNGAAGIVIVAGTGSVAYGEDAHAKTRMAGAYGYLIDDAGSGYGVGRAALAAVLRAADGTGEPTALAELIAAKVGGSERETIISAVYGGGLDRMAIAGLSSVCSEAAASGDAVASGILMRSGGALARLAEAVARDLFPDGAFLLVQAGSLWNAGPALTDVFVRSLARFAPKAEIVPPGDDPALGAARRALRASPQ